jgi:hypothetical protein
LLTALPAGAIAFLAGFFVARQAGGVELETQELLGAGYGAVAAVIAFVIGLWVGVD